MLTQANETVNMCYETGRLGQSDHSVYEQLIKCVETSKIWELQ